MFDKACFCTCSPISLINVCCIINISDIIGAGDCTYNINFKVWPCNSHQLDAFDMYGLCIQASYKLTCYISVGIHNRKFNWHAGDCVIPDVRADVSVHTVACNLTGRSRRGPYVLSHFQFFNLYHHEFFSVQRNLKNLLRASAQGCH